MKTLNLFAGIGGNRMLWEDVEVTAVEYNQTIALYYQKQYPDDVVIIGDAYDYLSRYFSKYEFIWASPPCQTHTLLNNVRGGRAYNETYNNEIVKIPDMRLYGLIYFLKHLFKGNWIVENVKPYYEPLIPPTAIVGRHYIWSNKPIRSKPENKKEHFDSWKDTCRSKGLDFHSLEDIKFSTRKDTILHNAVSANLGKYLLEEIRREKKITDVFIL